MDKVALTALIIAVRTATVHTDAVSEITVAWARSTRPIAVAYEILRWRSCDVMVLIVVE